MYPKVLILFETFHHNSGGGITLTNLFKDWDKSSIANSTFFYELENCFGNLICSNYYSLGGKELKANCLFFKFMEFGNSGMIVQNVEQIANSTKGMVPSFISSKFKESVKDIFKFFGFNGDIFSMSISNEFLDWLNKFNPDVIYAQPSNKATCLFLEELSNITEIPLVLHVMDDWISIGQKEKPNRISKGSIQEIFGRLLKPSNTLFTISEGMREAYKEYYGKDSFVFHNTLDIQKWVDYSKRTFEIGDCVRILYAGRIGLGIYFSLLEFIQASQELLSEGQNIEIHIQSPKLHEKYLKVLESYSCVIINEIVDYKILPQIFSTYDILLLCIDFKNKGKYFLKYSMPTKVPEFMISRTPILLYGPDDIFLTNSAISNKWAYVISENTKSQIKRGLIELVSDFRLRSTLSNNAYEYALKNYDGEKVRSEFRAILLDGISVKKY